jgi:hypothetical protein
MARARASVQVPGLGDCGGQFGERLRLGAGIGDGAGEGLGMIKTIKPRPYGGQAAWNRLVTDGDGTLVDGQLDKSLQIRYILSRDDSLSVPDLGESSEVASSGPQ